MADNVEAANGEDELQKQQQQLEDAAAEAKSRDEVDEAVDGTNGTTAAAADLIMFTPLTATFKRVSFGRYLSPKQFDNTLPPVTPGKR